MKNSHQNDTAILDVFCDLALDAGAKALEIYASEFVADEKSDASPVTQADRLGEEIITAGLQKSFPDIPILAEEAASEGHIPELGTEFFLVDPLDGTKEFIKKTGEFTVNIALVRDGEAVIGVVYAPASNKLYGGIVGDGAWMQEIGEDGKATPTMERTPISARTPPANGLTAVASRSHRSPETDDYLKTLKVADFAAAGSSLKFCLIAEGMADIYPRFGRTMEWDTGAGQAVLCAAGGSVIVHPDGEPLRYSKKERGFDNPYFIASGAQ